MKAILSYGDYADVTIATSYSMPKFCGKPQIVCHVNNQRDTKHTLINYYWMVANNITKVEFHNIESGHQLRIMCYICVIVKDFMVIRTCIEPSEYTAYHTMVDYHDCTRVSNV